MFLTKPSYKKKLWRNSFKIVKFEAICLTLEMIQKTLYYELVTRFNLTFNPILRLVKLIGVIRKKQEERLLNSVYC